jgi:phage-related protein
MYVLRGFVKKTKTAPKAELELAYQRLAEVRAVEKQARGAARVRRQEEKVK